MPSKHIKVIVYALFLFTCFGAGSAADIELTGAIRSNIVSDPSLHAPAEEVNYPWVGRLYGGTASVWSNRFELLAVGGKPSDNVYFRLPVDLVFSAVEDSATQSLTHRLDIAVNDYAYPILKVKNGGAYQATLAQNIMFKPMGILGNFKKYNETTRYDGSWGFNLTGTLGPAEEYALNIFQTRKWLAIKPITFYQDTIPEQVANLRTGARADGPTVGEYKGAWEQYPTYFTFGIQGGEPLLGEDVFGLFVGSKYMSNPDFMLNEDSASTQTVSSYNGQTARLAYRKDAVEVNWQRQLYWGDLTLAAALSQGKWWLELTDPAQGGRVNLGTLKDGAFSVDVAKAAIGPVEVQGRILQVGPDYQWVLARSTESAYGQSYGYKMPGRQALYPQQQVETSLSDVSQYLGMRRLTLNLSLPGTLLGMPATIRAAFLGNSWLDPQRRVADWDQSWGLVTSKDYQQIDLTLEASRQRDLFALALVNRNYLAMHREQVPDSLQAAKLNWQRAVGANNSLINTLELRRRALWDGPERDGYSYRFTSTFDGRLSSRIRLSAGVDWRQGNYDFGYMSAIDGDRILATQYRYFQSDLKYQQSKALSLGTLNVNCTLGGHLWLLQTDLLNVPSGLSAIGYGKATIPWFKNALNQNISLIVVSGPKELNFPTGYCIPALDNSLRYDFGGSKTTSLTLRTTQFFGDENTAPLFVTSARFRILAGSGSFNLYYGYWDWERLWAGDIDRYLTQRIHPLTGGTWDEWNYWYVSKLWKTYRSTQYTNHFRLEYAFRF